MSLAIIGRFYSTEIEAEKSQKDNEYVLEIENGFMVVKKVFVEKLIEGQQLLF